MAKRKVKNPFPWISSFNERKFLPFIRLIGQSTLLWNDLHEHLGHLYCIAIGGGFVNVHHQVWNSLSVDRAKRDMLMAAAQYTFADQPGKNQTQLEKKSFEAIKYLFDETRKIEDDRNNVVHAPLWKDSITGAVHPHSTFGNRRARNLDNKFLRPEYERIRDTTLLLRNYAVAVHDPMCDPRLAWPGTPKLPNRGGTKIPLPPRPKLPKDYLLQQQS
jgi:hypothetical protein